MAVASYENISDRIIERKVKHVSKIFNALKDMDGDELSRFLSQNPYILPKDIADVFYVIDKNGKLFWIRKPYHFYKGLYLGLEPFFNFQGNSFLGRSVFYSIFTSKPFLPFSIKTPRGYVFVAELNLDDLTEVAESINLKRFKGKGFLCLFDENGNLLSHPDKNLVLSRFNASWELDNWDRVKKGGYLSCNWRGEKLLVYSKRLERTGWVAFYGIPYHFVFDIIVKKKLGLNVLIFLFLSLVAYLFSRILGGRIAYPLEMLRISVEGEDFKKGKKIPDELSGNLLELSVLIDALNTSMEEVFRYRSQLEEQLKRIYGVFDGLNLFFSIVDVKNRDVLFANKFVRDIFGDDYRKKCHQYFFKRNSPCPRCDLERIEKGVLNRRISMEKGKVFEFILQIVEIPSLGECKVEIGFDITEEIKAKMELIKAEEKLSQVVDSMDDGVLVLDESGIVTHTNPSLLRILERDEDIRGLSYKEVFSGHLNPILEDLEDVMGEERSVKRYFEVEVGLDGKEKVLEGSVSKVYVDETPMILVVMRDITDKKILQESLLQRQKMETIGTLAGGIAHDFNNILAIMLGNVEMLALEYPEVSSSKFYQNITRSIDSASRMVRNLLSFAKPSSGEKEILDLGGVVEETLEMIKKSIPRSISLGFSGERGIFIEAQKNQIYQVAMNLILNACDAVKNVDNPRVEIVVDRVYIQGSEGGKLGVKEGFYGEVLVKDNGVGIPKEIRERIFDPFFTTKKRTTTKGLGLGLFLVYNIVKNLGGSITFETEEGKGTTFHVYIPEIVRRREKAGEKQVAGTVILRKALKVLLVDDEEDIRELGGYFLRRLGCEVEMAKDGEECLEKLERSKFDVIFLDLNMPKKDGMEVLREMEKRDWETPVVVLTGAVDGSVEEASSFKVVKDVLTKPFTMKKLSGLLYRISKNLE